MKMTMRIILVLTGGLFAAQVVPVSAQDARFFRLAGPVPTTITDVTADGFVTWTNQATNATFTVQTATILPGESNWVDWVQVPVSNAVTIHRIFDPNPPPGMALIPAGSFTMGATTNMGHESYTGETPQHTVYVSAFYCDRYEVTKALWDEVYHWATNRPVEDRYSFDFSNSGQGKANNHPAHSMTWYDAVKWCNARSEKEGRTPAYYTSTEQAMVYRSGQVNMQNDWVKWDRGYRLPTEAEWEKAARGGASGKRFPWSDANTINHGRANYYSHWFFGMPLDPYDVNATNGYHPTFATGGTPYTNPVDFFPANGYGLHDMAGNVWEWCWDWYLITYYISSPTSDPRGPASGLYRVARGGSWYGEAFVCRAAVRGDYSANRGIDVGVRSVLPLGQ